MLQSVHRKIINDSQFKKSTIHLFFIFAPLFKIIIQFKSETNGGFTDETNIINEEEEKDAEEEDNDNNDFCFR